MENVNEVWTCEIHLFYAYINLFGFIHFFIIIIWLLSGNKQFMWFETALHKKNLLIYTNKRLKGGWTATNVYNCVLCK